QMAYLPRLREGAMWMPSPDSKTSKFVLSAVLCGIALALSLLDSALSSMIPILPGFKLGLANVVSIFALYHLGFSYASLICVVRSVLTAVLSGNLTMLLFSLGGGLASILVMYLVMNRISLIKVSVLGGITHNILQVLAAMLVTQTPQTAVYLPVLVVTGAIGGFLMGVICKLVFGRVPKKLTLHAK
ncbi:MAG: Gx transporter family protein, partial [Christensenellaceae bacterium]